MTSVVIDGNCMALTLAPGVSYAAFNNLRSGLRSKSALGARGGQGEREERGEHCNRKQERMPAWHGILLNRCRELMERTEGALLRAIGAKSRTSGILFVVVASVVTGACAPRPTEVDVRIPSGSVVLAGTLLLPPTPGPHPGVVIVHGSGSQTRNAYRPIASAFARRGIAALIYDKRGTGGSNGNWQQSPFSALADDAQAAIDFMIRRPEVDSSRVGIWGGSEGGWIAPWVASRSGRVAFVIVQSAPVVGAVRQHLFQVEQLVRDAGGSPAEVQGALDFVRMQHRFSASGEGWAEYVRQLDANRSGLLAMLGGPTTPTDWWWAWSRTRMEFEPLRAWAGVSVPVLAVWGKHDHNVPVDESRALLERALQHSGNRAGTLITIDANHDLMPSRWLRIPMLIRNLVRDTPGQTPSMDLMAEWAAERFGRRSR